MAYYLPPAPCFITNKDAQERRPEMMECQELIRTSVQGYICSTFVDGPFPTLDSRNEWCRAGLMAPPLFRSLMGWKQRNIRPFKAPASMNASDRAPEGLLSLPGEVVEMIVEKLCRSGQVELAARNRASAALACRSLALAMNGRDVDLESLYDILRAGPANERYCGGCHKFRSTRGDREQYDDRDGNSFENYPSMMISGRKWLEFALLRTSRYVDLRDWRNVQLEQAERKDRSLWNDETMITFLTPSAAMRSFIDDWVTGGVWPRDACFLLQEEQGKGKLVLWCPTCRAPKICEDAILGVSIVANGGYADMQLRVGSQLNALAQPNSTVLYSARPHPNPLNGSPPERLRTLKWLAWAVLGKWSGIQ